MINAETDGELVKNAVRYEDTLKNILIILASLFF